MNTENILELNGVSKSYKDFTLQNVSFQLPKRIYHGACRCQRRGKKHYHQEYSQSDPPGQRGTSRYLALDNTKHDQEIKERLGIVFDETYFHSVLKPKQINKFMKDIYKTWDEEQFLGFLKKLKILLTSKSGLFPWYEDEALYRSRHVARRRPLILDEPTGGLDPWYAAKSSTCFWSSSRTRTREFYCHPTLSLTWRKLPTISPFDNGKVVLSESKDEILYLYGVLKGSLDDLNRVDKGISSVSIGTGLDLRRQ